MTQPYRLAQGGIVDRSRTLSFSFDGAALEGHPGDTLASALLANGVHLLGRSFKYHRPRGIVTAGADEPNALVQLARGARTEPNTRATQQELYEGLVAESQNRWPSLSFDIGALNDLASPLIPAGFY
ncbi:MAG: 2Fe-2S iron-sulfur cluster-binding protein, partial [Casimicrobiaceae bacterium]